MQKNKDLQKFLENEKLEFIGKRWHIFQLHVGNNDLYSLFDSLGAMIEAGIPIADALDVTREQLKNKYLRDVLYISRKFVENGKPLNYAFSLFPETFNPIMISVLKSGEISGTLAKSCGYISEDIQSNSDLKQKLITIAIYPFFVVMTLIGVLIFMLIAVVPKISVLYVESEQSLPFLTRAIISLSEFVTSLNFLIFLAVLIFLIILINVLLKKEKYKKTYHSFLLKVPLLSNFLKESILLKFSRTFSVVLKSGVPILESLEIVGETMSNLIYKDAVKKLRSSVERGKPISETIVQDKSLYPKLFFPMSVKVIAVGEKSGNLHESLGKLAIILDKNLNKSIQLFYSLLEPVLLILIAVVVGIVVLAITLPIYQLPTTITGV